MTIPVYSWNIVECDDKPPKKNKHGKYKIYLLTLHKFFFIFWQSEVAIIIIRFVTLVFNWNDRVCVIFYFTLVESTNIVELNVVLHSIPFRVPNRNKCSGTGPEESQWEQAGHRAEDSHDRGGKVRSGKGRCLYSCLCKKDKMMASLFWKWFDIECLMLVLLLWKGQSDRSALIKIRM